MKSQENYNENEYISLTDLGLISALSLYTQFLVTRSDEDKKVTFHFQRSEETEKLISEYLNNTLTVKAKDFSEQIKNIKTVIYQGSKYVK